MSVRLGRFIERSGVLPTTQFAYRKGLGTCDACLCVSHTVQSALESGLSNRSQHVVVDGCRSKLVNVVSGVPHYSVFDPLLFLLYTSELFSILENKLIGQASELQRQSP